MVPSAWNDPRIGADPSGAYISVSSGAFRSYYKLFASDAGRVYPYMTAIISVKKGVVSGSAFATRSSPHSLVLTCAHCVVSHPHQIQGVTWDDGCYFCDPETCEPNLFGSAANHSASRIVDSGYTCYSPMTACTGENATTCDITLYVGWTGTDKSGNYLSSAGLRMSQFKKYSIATYFKKIANSFSNLLPSSRFDT